MARKATVKDIADFFNNLVAEGKGDYAVDATTMDGASYDLFVREDAADYELCNGIACVYDKIKLVTIGE